jgi:hypothetical protein
MAKRGFSLTLERVHRAAARDPEIRLPDGTLYCADGLHGYPSRKFVIRCTTCDYVRGEQDPDSERREELCSYHALGPCPECSAEQPLWLDSVEGAWHPEL